jgi:hypothetical protein
MIKIISERHRESHTEYSLQFDLIGERKGNGYGFPLLSKAIIPLKESETESNKYVPCSEEDCTWWKSYLSVKEDREHYKEPYVDKNAWYWTEPAHALCKCGTEILLEDDYMGACQCPNCEQWYNLFGEEVKDPDKWEDDSDDEY